MVDVRAEVFHRVKNAVDQLKKELVKSHGIDAAIVNEISVGMAGDLVVVDLPVASSTDTPLRVPTEGERLPANKKDGVKRGNPL